MGDMSETTTNKQAPAPQVWPTLRARDARALIRFLVDVVGFEETLVVGEGDRVQHCELSWPAGGGIMLGSAGERGADDRWALQPGSFGCYAVTDDVDKIYDRVKDAPGVTIVTEPADADYGNHEFAMRDPEGNLWSFGTYRGEPR
jgi:uncharacterized glyoxalase superfamily protein PhnB